MDSSRLHTVFLVVGGILIAGLACLVYWPGLHGPFVFDDISNILIVPQLRITSLDFDSLKKAAYWQNTASIGRPLAMLSFALNYYFGHFNVFYFKLTNLFIHLLNGALLYWLSHRLLLRLHTLEPQKGFNPQQIKWLSAVVCAIWLIHPLNLTSVLYVVQRMTSLSALFVLLGLVGYIIGREQLLREKTYGFLTILGSITLFGGLAILSKENGVLLLLYMLVIEIIFYRFSAGTQHLKNKLIWAWTISLTLPFVALVIITIIWPDRLATIFSYQYRDFTLVERLLTESRAIWFYLKLILIPNIREMGVYHDDFIISRSLLDPPSTIQAVIGILALFFTAILTVRKLPMLSFALAWFLAGHTLESTVLPLELVHEHRNYLPQYGIILGAAYYLAYPYKSLGKSLILRRGLLIVFLALLTSVTYARAQDWKDEWTLYSRDVINHPASARSQTMLGIILQDNRQYSMAEEHFLKAVELEPRDSKTIIRLAQHYYGATRKIPEPVMTQLEYGLMNLPYSGVTIWSYEPLLIDTAKDPKLNLRIIHIYERLILRKDFYLGDAWHEVGYSRLGFAYRERKDYKKATAYFERALDINPRPLYHLALAGIYNTQGKKDLAKDQLKIISGKFNSLSADDKAGYTLLYNELNPNSEADRTK